MRIAPSRNLIFKLTGVYKVSISPPGGGGKEREGSEVKGNFPLSAPLAKKFGERNQVEKMEVGKEIAQVRITVA